MGWGDWPSWVAIVVSVVTAVVTWLQGRRQAEAATAAAAQATALAEDANRSAASMARSLDAIARTLAPSRGGVGAREATVDPRVRSGRPAWNVEYRGGEHYVLRNVGDGAASGVRVDGPPGVALHDAPAGVGLAPGEGAAFTLGPSARPMEVTITCAETGTQTVPLP